MLYIIFLNIHIQNQYFPGCSYNQSFNIEKQSRYRMDKYPEISVTPRSKLVFSNSFQQSVGLLKGSTA